MEVEKSPEHVDPKYKLNQEVEVGGNLFKIDSIKFTHGQNYYGLSLVNGKSFHSGAISVPESLIKEKV